MAARQARLAAGPVRRAAQLRGLAHEPAGRAPRERATGRGLPGRPGWSNGAAASCHRAAGRQRRGDADRRVARPDAHGRRPARVGWDAFAPVARAPAAAVEARAGHPRRILAVVPSPAIADGAAASAEVAQVASRQQPAPGDDARLPSGARQRASTPEPAPEAAPSRLARELARSAFQADLGLGRLWAQRSCLPCRSLPEEEAVVPRWPAHSVMERPLQVAGSLQRLRHWPRGAVRPIDRTLPRQSQRHAHARPRARRAPPLRCAKGWRRLTMGR
jgi:hypothetical protein